MPVSVNNSLGYATTMCDYIYSDGFHVQNSCQCGKFQTVNTYDHVGIIFNTLFLISLGSFLHQTKYKDNISVIRSSPLFSPMSLMSQYLNSFIRKMKE